MRGQGKDWNTEGARRREREKNKGTKRKGKRGQDQEQETKNDLDKTEEKYNRKFEKLGKKKRGRAKRR